MQEIAQLPTLEEYLDDLQKRAKTRTLNPEMLAGIRSLAERVMDGSVLDPVGHPVGALFFEPLGFTQPVPEEARAGFIVEAIWHVDFAYDHGRKSNAQSTNATLRRVHGGWRINPRREPCARNQAYLSGLRVILRHEASATQGVYIR
ncbi:hypothetical protein DB347_20780 [Opitutaceae bacterium EW11]|nr:hypothetical protein DB347_20780 [Opitutaceae bacterium EW11]